jgi:hypothetical protein
VHHDENKKANRLIHEKSPYLLQHAYNPVDWYPWGEEAFERARREDKPIFLSIGYSTCHWCHVMERESFEDDEVAEVLNRGFVCIKVDREERPDINGIYMSVCQAMTGNGGWPLTILMAPDKRPFYAGTYFPKKTQYGRMGVIELAQRIEKLWLTAREEINKTAESVIDSLQTITSVNPGDVPGEDVMHLAYEQLEKRYDPQYGGFGSAPKFPTPHNLSFLLRYWKRTKNKKALEMVEKTLTEMSIGGIYDHLGFGFHRYSTNREWLVPHFEKMLYDQALLAIVYLETYQATGNDQYATAAKEIFTYVLRDMTSTEGGFLSAEDADSEGMEGKFYVWSLKELNEILGEEDAATFAAVYNVRDKGNFHDEATRTMTGENILHMTKTLPELAELLFMEVGKLADKLEFMRQTLFNVREKRIHPYKDDKVLTDWNGLMIAAMAIGGRVLGVTNYTEGAAKAAAFIKNRLKKDGRLIKRYREGEASLPAHLDDYAFLVWGLIELYETTFDVAYLEEALSLNETQIELFWDKENGSFYFTSEEGEKLLVRHRELYDGAVPSGNSVSALNNLRLARITGNSQLEEIATKIARAYSRDLNQSPSAFTQMLVALDFAFGPSLEVVIAGDAGAADTQNMLKELRTAFVPNKVVVLHPSGDGKAIEKLAPYSKEQLNIDGKAAAYVCRNHTCQAPVTSAEEMMSIVKDI